MKNVVFLTTDTHANLIGEIRLQTLESGGPVGTGIWEAVTGPVATNTYAKEIDRAIGAQGHGRLRHVLVPEAAAAARDRDGVRGHRRLQLQRGRRHRDDADGDAEDGLRAPV